MDWELPFYGSQNCGLLSVSAMLGFSVTILIGAYSNDARDVAIVADRRRSPVNAQGMEPIEDAHKTLRLGPECAIGFAGAEPLENAVLARLYGISWPYQDRSLMEDLVAHEHEYGFGFDTIRKALDQIVPEVIRGWRPPTGQTMYVILAGMMHGKKSVPMVAGICAGSDWRMRPYFGDVWSMPRGSEEDTFDEEMGFREALNPPGMDYGERMLAAVKFCTKYPSVNNRYIIRRLSAQFVQEPGTV